MKKCLREIWYCIHKSNSFIILIFSLQLISLVGSKFVYSYTKQIEQSKNNYEVIYENSKYHRIHDNFVGEYQTYPQQVGVHEKLVEFNHKLNTFEQFTYIEQNEQYISMTDFSGDKKLLYGYESGDYSDDIYITTNDSGHQTQWASFRGLYVGKEYFSCFPTKSVKGRLFEENDFIFEEGKPIPVILGNGFVNVYNIGDEILAKTPFMETKTVVIGFLSDTATKYEAGGFKSLNRYILFPMFDLYQINDSSDINRDIFYYMKNIGLIKTSKSANDTQLMIDQLCNELNLEPVFYVDGATNSQSNSLHMNMETVTALSYLIASIFIVFVVILMIVYLSMKLRNNSYYFSILYLNGFTSKEITCIIIGELLFVLSLSNVVGEVAYRLIMDVMHCPTISLLYNVILSILLILVPVLFTIIKLKHTDLCQIIGGKE